ncbi:MAG: hypothetical protein UU95_C0024G0017 [Parcubacteria group bacterium GW2011_GWC2_42_12]|nr:MAG: hypothetical protein UU43_C0001G0114 [Candidatus Falkowbacteria bacterium GW2011_GWA2_41_14]KKS33710.1 MAG: hypothetical protein UU95_C0024G0017 [Parcubacteria group bacterium GW2011_GWC2_42_12]
MKTNITVIGATLMVAIIGTGCGTFRGHKQPTRPPVQVAPATPAPAPVIPATGPQYLFLNAGPTSQGGNATPQTVSFDTTKWTGMVGGVPCLLGNKTSDVITLSIRNNNGDTFTVELGAGGTNRVYNIIPGVYTYTYWTDKNPSEQTSRRLEVYKNPCHTLDGVGSYHAVVIFRP